MAKRSVKQKSTQTAASAQQDVVGLITTLIQKLVVLETKIDNVLNRVSHQPMEAPRQHQYQRPAPSVPAAHSNMHNNNRRPMYSAVCADCGKNCEVPFRPSADRSVYCKICFTARKKKDTFVPRPSTAPMSAPAPEMAAPVAKKKKTVKKSAKKKK